MLKFLAWSKKLPTSKLKITLYVLSEKVKMRTNFKQILCNIYIKSNIILKIFYDKY